MPPIYCFRAFWLQRFLECVRTNFYIARQCVIMIQQPLNHMIAWTNQDISIGYGFPLFPLESGLFKRPSPECLHPFLLPFAGGMCDHTDCGVGKCKAHPLVSRAPEPVGLPV